MAVAASIPVEIALKFAQALVEGNFEAARLYLSPALQGQYPAPRLQQVFAAMVAYGDGPPTDVEAIATLDNWPDKRPQDWRWVYVSIAGDGYGEAVTVIVGRDHLIHALEWGRP
ncbi:hypothetical protein NIES970_14980 [[Synechococcus] sp. NIES-970]|nr:hypothetical protein NIES970_14980 [[Synechococcus] sp. NIES-970]